MRSGPPHGRRGRERRHSSEIRPAIWEERDTEVALRNSGPRRIRIKRLHSVLPEK